MTASAAQLQFAAEFTSFLSAAAGLALVALRGDLAARTRAGRVALGIGFVLLGAAAFVHGSSLLADLDNPLLLLLRAGGVVGCGAAATTWVGGRASRATFLAGIAGVAVA